MLQGPAAFALLVDSTSFGIQSLKTANRLTLSATHAFSSGMHDGAAQSAKLDSTGAK
jgi:hypothetical protein